MTDQTTHKSTDTPPLDMETVTTSSMALATARTIAALIDAGELNQSDFASARLAVEIAERIDADGLDVGISLYTRLWFCLRDLNKSDAEQASGCPLARQLVQAVDQTIKRE